MKLYRKNLTCSSSSFLLALVVYCGCGTGPNPRATPQEDVFTPPLASNTFAELFPPNGRTLIQINESGGQSMMLDPNGNRCYDSSVITLDANTFKFEKACRQDGVLRPDDASVLFQKSTQEFLSESPQFLTALSAVADGQDIRQPERDVSN